jgi:TRAP-type C4-dicarboxylate transport system permease large subunit
MTDWILGLGLSNLVLLLAIAVFLLVSGLFIDTLPGVLLFVPIIAPMADAVGINPIQTAVVVVLALTMGMITPPVGGVLFVVTTVSRIPLVRVVASIWPFYFAIFAVLLLLVIFPTVSTWLPAQFGYRFN